MQWTGVSEVPTGAGTFTKQLDMGTSGPNTAFPLLVASCTFRGEDLGLDIPCKELN